MEEETIYVDQNGNRVDPPRGSDNRSYPPATTSRSDKADLLDKIKPDVIVETIRQKLMGRELVNGKWVSMPQLQSRAITDVGAWDIANLMLGASSQNVSLSKLRDDEIRARTLEICRTAQHLCLKNWKQYGIKGSDQLEYIHQIIMTNTFITLKQPQDGGIRDLLKGTTQESRVISANEEKRGMISRLWKR